MFENSWWEDLLKLYKTVIKTCCLGGNISELYANNELFSFIKCIVIFFSVVVFVALQMASRVLSLALHTTLSGLRYVPRILWRSGGLL
jgi:hypothetical protein